MTVRNVGIRLKSEGKAEIKRDLQEVGQAGKAAGQDVVTAFDQSAVAADRQSKALDRQMERWKSLAKAAREAQTAEEQQAKYNAILGVGGSSGKSAATSAEAFMGGSLTRAERAGRLNLARQGADVFTTAAMGMNPGMIAIQQGPQILDALVTSGIRLTPVMVGLGGAFTVTAAAVIAAGVAQDQYEKSVLGVEVATRGLGASAGMTGDAVLRQADAAAEAGRISAASAREYAAEYVATGKIGQGVLQDLVAITRDYAATTRQDAAGATKDLGRAFADPAKGAADLNDKLHFLRQSELEHIENLARAGREAEAQAILVDKLKGALIDAADATTGWGRVADDLKLKWLGVWDAVGKAVDRMVTGGNSEARVATARQTIRDADEALRNEPAWARNIPGSAAADWARRRAEAQALIDAEYKKYVAEQDRLRQAALSERDQDRQTLIDRYNPNVGKLRQLRADRDKLTRLGVNDDASRKALSDLNAEISALEKGYKSAAEAAAALARANRTATRDAAKEAREAAEAKRKADDLDLRRLRGQVTIAKASEDESAIAWAEIQLRLKEEIVQRERDGLSTAEARIEAERQVGDELKAQYAAILRQNSDAELVKDNFKTAEERMAEALKGANIEPFTAKTALFESLTTSTRDAFHDGLMAGSMNSNFLDVFTQRLKYAAASAFADIATTGLFGKKDGSGKAGLLSAAFSLFPKHAKGTDNAPGGWSIVGEEGPELMNLRAGARVISATDTRQLLDRAGQAVTAQSNSTVQVNFTHAPTIDARGAGPNEVSRLEALMQRQQRDLPEQIVVTVQDALNRRMIKV
ncbi:phage tail length tape measure family protein [Caulobacter sp. BP25]|uniref:phage tail length tape measure family protein n=1 Tax=Caulobacter sp. BP25 TaxID=2048900 RepID=UPI000C12C302|nr:phage tail length tape measure family protein [Caulobacter sp. BP25]PHY20929.1 hypothetical protein CSW59_06895 [Caulobacter sp. BP25]